MKDSFVLGHRAALDGLRGVAVLLVFLSHIDIPWLPTKGGFIGVHIFFALSGFLITSLLLEEQQETGSIRLRSFYMRRILRLLPALFLLLTVSVAKAGLFGSPLEFRNVRTSALMTIFYSTNWFVMAGKFPTVFLSHAWSLSCEEHFYIVWPLVLSILFRVLPRKRILFVILGLILMIAVWRIVLLVTTRDLDRIYFGSDTNADGFLIGDTLAFLMALGYVPKSRTALRILQSAGVLIVILIPVGLTMLVRYGETCWWMDVVGLLGIHAGTALLMMALLLTPLGTLFGGKILGWIGRVSYGLYLWHLPMGYWVEGWLGSSPFSSVVWIISTFSVTALSFYVIERPCLLLKKRFQRVPEMKRVETLVPVESS